MCRYVKIKIAIFHSVEIYNEIKSTSKMPLECLMGKYNKILFWGVLLISNFWKKIPKHLKTYLILIRSSKGVSDLKACLIFLSSMLCIKNGRENSNVQNFLPDLHNDPSMFFKSLGPLKSLNFDWNLKLYKWLDSTSGGMSFFFRRLILSSTE